MAASPGWGLNYDPPASEWNFWWASKVDQANPVLTGPLVPFSWTTANRPTSPALYATGFNTTLNLLETWNGTAWGTAAGSFTANGSVATALTSVGPTGAHTTVQEWLTITDAAGTVRYIPCF